MTSPKQVHLSRRERQIMDVLYRQGRASAAEVLSAIPDPPSYSAVRAMLRVLENKGHVRHEEQGLRYVWVPTVPPERAKRSALLHLLDTYFQGSPGLAAAALLDLSAAKLSDQELDQLSQLIEKARKEGSS